MIKTADREFDPDLDVAIAREVMDWTRISHCGRLMWVDDRGRQENGSFGIVAIAQPEMANRDWQDTNLQLLRYFAPSDAISDAMLVVERMKAKGHDLSHLIMDPKAVCIAALKALQVFREGSEDADGGN